MQNEQIFILADLTARLAEEHLVDAAYAICCGQVGDAMGQTITCRPFDAPHRHIQSLNRRDTLLMQWH